MFEHEGLFFHSFYWLALFPLFLSLFSYQEAHDGVRFLAQSAKNNTHRKKTPEKQIDGLILQWCGSRDRNKALCLNHHIKETPRGYTRIKIPLKSSSLPLFTPVIFFTEVDRVKPENDEALQWHRNPSDWLQSQPSGSLLICYTIAALKRELYCHWNFTKMASVWTPEQNFFFF